MLDSHTLLWWLKDSPRLSVRARGAIADRRNEPWASAVTGYELVNKQRLGKLQPPLVDELLPMMRRAGLPMLAVSFEHAVTAAGLPGPHRDPWDRLLMAQARLGQLVVVTTDPIFASYGIVTLW